MEEEDSEIISEFNEGKIMNWINYNKIDDDAPKKKKK